MATTAADPAAAAVPPVATGIGPGQRVFVDANVLVFAAAATAPLHAAARAALDALDQAGAEVWTSRQVLREYLAAMTRPQPFAGPVPVAAALADVNRFLNQFRIAEDGPAVFAQLLVLLAAVSWGGKQVHDANIVATMRAHGIPSLLTHNTADFARYTGYIAVVPLTP
jgi:predicted nucleic acid-binding protein